MLKSPVRLALMFLFLLFGTSAAESDTSRIQSVLNEAHQRFASVADGKNADYIPYLAGVDSNLFGLAVVTVDGEVLTAGDSDYQLAIESISKVFTLSLALQENGPEVILEKIGVEPTGLPFNSVMAVELEPDHTVNPLVNAGAMATTSLIKGPDRWNSILSYYGKFAGEPLQLIEAVDRSEAATNTRNRALANLLHSYGRMYCPPDEALDEYTKQCSVGVSARQLAMMGATLANGGVHPKNGERVLEEALVPKVLAVMQTGGFYDGSGQWTYEVGLPGKTGVGGGIVVVVPGRMALAAFSPPLDEHGNSVRAQLALKFLAQELGLNLFFSPIKKTR